MNKKKISAEIIADSKSELGHRLTTFVLTMPRIVLAEFNTHRMFSRNSASSRAIPFKKMMDMCLDDPFIPIAWMKEHKGMQGTEYFTEERAIEKLNRIWLQSRVDAVGRAQELSELGLSKQICNRVMEPYMWHTVIVTASEWQNFFALRAHPAAEIHIQKLAEVMLDEYNKSEPKVLNQEDWHIPFGDKFDSERIKLLMPDEKKNIDEHLKVYDLLRIKIATARCARVSYNNFEGKDDYEADIKLHDQLSISGHWSPFEHCAQARRNSISGNFKGFLQYRKFFENENKDDSRVLVK